MKIKILTGSFLSAALGQSGFLDGQVFLDQAAFFLQPEALKRFYHFYYYQIQENDRYGCHCQLKDLVSQDYIDYQEGEEHFQYHGKPVDSLDKGCHDHRECLKCAQRTLGCANDGISEHFLNYKISSIGYCSDDLSTCERAYCECATQFLHDIHNKGVFDYAPKYFSVNGGDFKANEENCKVSRSKSGENSNFEKSVLARRNERNNQRKTSCCARTGRYSTGPWRLYNTDKLKCCEDGEARTDC